MSDLISRQAAIDALDGEITVTGRANAEAVLGYVNLVCDRIKRLPSAQPERKKGKWIDDADTFYKAVNEKGGGVNEDTPYFVDDIACSECLSLFSVIDNCTEKFDFCPNCGADMRGE